jgi:YegS/Rv2252/BmrU family lipid kinase
MRVVLIVNPIAGAGAKRCLLSRMIALARQSGIEIDYRLTHGAGSARRLAAGLSADLEKTGSIRAVMVVGGDGTVHEVADGLAGGPLPLLVWPTGTENLFAKSFHFQATPRAALDCLLSGQMRLIDLGQANGRTFLIVAGMGFDAEVVHRLVGRRTGHITHLTYSAPLWRTFWEHRFPRFRVYDENTLIWEGQGLVFVGNLPRYSLGLRVLRDAVCDDGFLDLCVLPCRGRLRFIGHSLRTLLRTHVEQDGVLYRRLRRIRVESDDPVPVELDGEAAGWLPLELGVRPGALRVLVPPDATKL